MMILSEVRRAGFALRDYRSMIVSMPSLVDALRQMQGEALGALGFGPSESPRHILAATSRWRLRDYGGSHAGPPLLIIASPIKRPYIWDLAPSVSAVRYCVDHGQRVFLVEWLPPSEHDDGGLDDYADRAISQCVAAVSRETGRERPVLMGHSLGGTLAAIFAGLESDRLRGLVLLAAPLCFEAASSRFRDAVTSMAPAALSETEVVPGWVLSRFSALASPSTFIWSRYADAALSLGHPQAIDIHVRVERWALDEVALPGRLVNQILQWLYRENRLCQGTLPVRDRTVGPSSVSVPTLTVVNTADDVTPRGAVAPFLEAMPIKNAHLIEHPGETGVGLQHLAILIGHEAHMRVWPQIMSWLDTLTSGAEDWRSRAPSSAGPHGPR